ncbi:MAG TPA: hypothetical protein VD860_12240 [Azospirillum sp.]|nr:hypothetical protein [Azospirillum sp.]
MTLTPADLDYLHTGLQRGERLHPLALGLDYRTADALVLDLLALVGAPNPAATKPVATSAVALTAFDAAAVGIAVAGERCESACRAPTAEDEGAGLPGPHTQARRILMLLRAGKAIQEIVEGVGCKRQAVYDVRAAERRAGRPLPTVKKDPAPIGKLPQQEVIDRYRAGETLTALAAEAGLSANGVRFRLRNAGVKIGPQPTSAPAKGLAIKTTPPGASATMGDNAGTAAAPCEATGQPRPSGQGSDEVPPLREVGKGVGAPEPANASGQSDRPTPYTPPPPAPGSARDLAAMVEAAIAAGKVKVTLCPTSAAAPTEGARIKPEEAAKLRAHAEGARTDEVAEHRARAHRGHRRRGMLAATGRAA